MFRVCSTKIQWTHCPFLLFFEISYFFSQFNNIITLPPPFRIMEDGLKRVTKHVLMAARVATAPHTHDH